MSTSIETKKPVLVHPLWIHLPAIAALAAFVIVLIVKSPLPARAPVHFRFNGQPNAFGSPWGFAGVTIGISILFIGISVFIDEFWARQEKAKHFNWLTPLDDVVVGWMAGMGINYLLFLDHWLKQDDTGFGFGFAILLIGATLALSLIIEAFRPYRAYSYNQAGRETLSFFEDLKQQLKGSARFIYWDNQNPFWVTLMSIFFPALFLTLAVVFWFQQIWIFYEMAILGILFILPYGGQRVLVTRQEVAVRWGVFGFRVMRLKTEDIGSAEVMEFSPLRDFGGLGIRFGQGMTAYFLRGTRGVVVTTKNSKKYLVGSDNPEQLLAVIKAVIAG